MGSFVSLFLLWTLVSGSAGSDQPGDPILDQAIGRALRDNPDVAEMELRIAAARARAEQAGSLPPPIAEFGLMNVPIPSLSFSSDEMTMKTVGLKQDLPARGRRAAGSRAAQAAVEVANQEHAVHVERLIAEVADAYFELVLLDTQIGIRHRTIPRLERIADFARERYRVGKSALADVLLASVQATKARDEIRAMEAQRVSVAARFATLQGLPATEPMAPLQVPVLDLEPPSEERLSAAMEGSPALRQATAEVERERLELEETRLERRPDFALAGSYGQRQGLDDMVTLTAGISLPGLRRGRVAAQLAEKEADLAAAQRRLASTRSWVAREAETAVAQIRALGERASLYRSTVLTQDRTAAEAAEQAYAVGSIDFQAYLSAVLAVDQDEAETVQRELDLMRAKARLQAITALRFFGPSPMPEEGS